MEFIYIDNMRAIEAFSGLNGEFLDELSTLELAEQALESLTAAVADMREALVSYVQVRFNLDRNSVGQAYTYIDPSGKLKVGDLVRAPVYSGDFQTAKVVALGRGAWQGRCKTLAAKLTEELL